MRALGTLLLLGLSYVMLLAAPQVAALGRSATEAVAAPEPTVSWVAAACAAGLALGGGAALVYALVTITREAERRPYDYLAPVVAAFAGCILIGLRAPLPLPGVPAEHVSVFALAVAVVGGSLIQTPELPAQLTGLMVTFFPPMSLLGVMWAASGRADPADALWSLPGPVRAFLGMLTISSFAIAAISALVRGSAARPRDAVSVTTQPVPLPAQGGRVSIPKPPPTRAPLSAPALGRAPLHVPPTPTPTPTPRLPSLSELPDLSGAGESSGRGPLFSSSIIPKLQRSSLRRFRLALLMGGALLLVGTILTLALRAPQAPHAALPAPPALPVVPAVEPLLEVPDAAVAHAEPAPAEPVEQLPAPPEEAPPSAGVPDQEQTLPMLDDGKQVSSRSRRHHATSRARAHHRSRRERGASRAERTSRSRRSERSAVSEQAEEPPSEPVRTVGLPAWNVDETASPTRKRARPPARAEPEPDDEQPPDEEEAPRAARSSRRSSRAAVREEPAPEPEEPPPPPPPKRPVKPGDEALEELMNRALK